jgi:hypothetical protein
MQTAAFITELPTFHQSFAAQSGDVGSQVLMVGGLGDKNEVKPLRPLHQLLDERLL